MYCNKDVIYTPRWVLTCVHLHGSLLIVAIFVKWVPFSLNSTILAYFPYFAIKCMKLQQT
jgi:hypothetical protein